MPVPGGGFKTEVLLGRKVAFHGAEQTDEQEYGSDQYMEPVEAGCHEEG